MIGRVADLAHGELGDHARTDANGRFCWTLAMKAGDPRAPGPVSGLVPDNSARMDEYVRLRPPFSVAQPARAIAMIGVTCLISRSAGTA